MAIAFDAVTGYTLSGTTSDTFAHTVTGANTILWVCAQTGSAGTPAISGVTYNGVSMTAAASSGVQTGSNANQRIFLYYLVGPATGAHNVVIS